MAAMPPAPDLWSHLIEGNELLGCGILSQLRRKFLFLFTLLLPRTSLCYSLYCCCGGIMPIPGLAECMCYMPAQSASILPGHPGHHFCNSLLFAALGSCLHHLYYYALHILDHPFCPVPLYLFKVFYIFLYLYHHRF